MTGASKILTVSYGTFSCTLEGFDDPFNTMKAIAEYFRDLAAEDRYFGAEPPTPDAAMLHRIAEREIHRRVEAKIQDNGVILRAAEESAPALIEPAPTPKITMPAAAIAAAAVEAPIEAPSLADAAPAAASAAAKLQRIRAAQDVAPVVSAETSADADADADADDILASIAAQAADASPAAEVNLVSTTSVAYRAEEAFEDIEPTPDFDLTALAASADDGAMPQEFVDSFDADLAEDDAAVAEDTSAEGKITGDSDAASVEDLAEIDAEDLADLARLDGTDSVPYATELVEETFGSETFDESFEADAPVAEVIVADIAVSEDAPAETQISDAPGAEDYEDETLGEPVSALPVLEDVLGNEDDSDDFLNGESFLAALNDAQPEPVQPHRTAPLAELSVEDDTLLANLGALIDPEDDDESLFAEEPVAAPVTTAPVATAQADDDVAAILDIPAESPVAEQAAPVAEAVAAPAVGEKLQRARNRVIRIRRAEVAPVAEASIPEPQVPEAPAIGAAAPPAKPIASLLSPEAEAALQAELAELEAELGGPVSAIATEALRAVDAKPVAAEDSHEAAEEDDFAAELSARLAAEQAQDTPPATESLPSLESDREDDAVSRLIAQTNSAMDGAETRRRQSAIAHLKAAVAATEADRQLRGNTSGAEGEIKMEAYRNDLERVVRPSRPVPASGSAAGGSADGGSAERPTPLVLVSEQRIDRVKAEEAAPVAPAVQAPIVPVRPRRVSSSLALQPQVLADAVADAEDDEDLSPEEALNLFADSKGFEDFADRLGATRLPDLLEAAAVYCAEVLNRPEFSRPLLMHQITAVPGGAGLSREDCLRSFGTLLRQGRITKLKRGQFALTDRSPYLAEAKRIAG